MTSSAQLLSAPSTAPLCLVAGVGPGIGAALVRKFASHGFIVLMLARSADFLTSLSTSLLSLSPPLYALPYPTDLTSPTSLTTTFSLIHSAFPPLTRPITVLLFNAAQRRLRPQPLESITSDEMLRLYHSNALAFHSLVRHVVPGMRAAGQGGTIIATGATGGVRSSPGFGSFSASKWALRAMVGCLAKEMAEGAVPIHVAHVIVDAVVDTPLLHAYVDRQRDKQSRAEQQLQNASAMNDEQRQQQKQALTAPPADAIRGRDASSIVLAEPDAIAAMYWHLHTQPPNAWSLEVDLRPFNELITSRL